MIQKILYISISILIFSCSTAQKTDNIIERCSIKEETFEKSSMRKFLNATENRRDIIDKFIFDNSSYSILSVQNENVIYAFYKDGIWDVTYNDDKYLIKDDALIPNIEKYSIKKTVYKTTCPDNYVVNDSNDPLLAFWIKNSSEINFLYYSTKCNVFCLNKKDQKRISLLMEINERFQKKQ